MTTLNYSTSHETNFRLVFPFLPFLSTADVNEKGTSFLLYCKSVNLPSVSMEVTDIGTVYNTLKRPSKEISYTDIVATFAVDELFSNYKMLLDWLYYLKNPETFGHNTQMTKVDGALHILSNNKNPKAKFILHNIFPINLSEIPFTVTSTESADLNATVTFSVEYFKLENE